MDGKNQDTKSKLQIELTELSESIKGACGCHPLTYRDVGDISIYNSMYLQEFFNKDLTVEEIEICKLLLKGISEYTSDMSNHTRCTTPGYTEDNENE